MMLFGDGIQKLHDQFLPVYPVVVLFIALCQYIEVSLGMMVLCMGNMNLEVELLSHESSDSIEQFFGVNGESTHEVENALK